jgi:hypothetical protein
MLPRGLPIIILQGLMPVTMLVNLLEFLGTRNEDPTTHVKQFVEVFITSLVIDPNYYLIWFPTTLDGFAYVWYRSHSAGTFASWQELQVAFLWQLCPEIGQQNALMALSNIRQGVDEDITSYVRCFRVVCTKFVGQMLIDWRAPKFLVRPKMGPSMSKSGSSWNLVPLPTSSTKGG